MNEIKFRLITFVAIIGGYLLIAPAACSRPDDARRILEQQGFTNIQITGYRWMASREDAFATGFEATSPNGSRVSGAVTSGFIKGGTIRFD